MGSTLRIIAPVRGRCPRPSRVQYESSCTEPRNHYISVRSTLHVSSYVIGMPLPCVHGMEPFKDARAHEDFRRAGEPNLALSLSRASSSSLASSSPPSFSQHRGLSLSPSTRASSTFTRFDSGRENCARQSEGRAPRNSERGEHKAASAVSRHRGSARGRELTPPKAGSASKAGVYTPFRRCPRARSPGRDAMRNRVRSRTHESLYATPTRKYDARARHQRVGVRSPVQERRNGMKPVSGQDAPRILLDRGGGRG